MSSACWRGETFRNVFLRDRRAVMRIALVLDRFDPSGGGLERWASQLAQWLVSDGHEVHVVAAEIADECVVPGGLPHRLPAAASRLRRAAAAACCLRALQADIVHDLGTGWYFDVFQPQFGSRIVDWRQTILAEPRYRRPLTVLSPWRYRGYLSRRQLERRQLGSRRGIIVAVSHLVEAHLCELHGVEPERIRVVYNGVDTAHFTPARRATERGAIRTRLGLNEEVLFLVAAHNLKLKGAAIVLSAFQRVARENAAVRLAFIGRDDSQPYVAQARSLGIANRCFFLGFVEDSAGYYSAADVFLHPTFYDPCSLAVLEAWASGLPVITSRFNGVAELMISGRHGFVLPDPGDVGELATTMRHLLNAELRAAMASSARSLALANSSTANFQKIKRVYESILERRRYGRAERWQT
ncbi:MAG: rfaG [Deltaproteobacteria bacterium]|nr:rfaG [Deltaproteobacteria bacterium]